MGRTSENVFVRGGQRKKRPKKEQLQGSEGAAKVREESFVEDEVGLHQITNKHVQCI